MKTQIRLFVSLSTAALVMALLFVCGCGGQASHPDKDFTTSGSHEADQRAEQRMAENGQLKGGSGSQSGGAQEKKTLYDRLGGQDQIQAIADDFVTRAMADPRVNFTRKGVIYGGIGIHREHSEEWDASDEHVKALKQHLAQFLAVASGGPSTYQGREMKDSHKDLHI